MSAVVPVPHVGPRRIQLRRIKGWRKPSGAVVVARPTRWGNPFVVDGTRILFHGTELWSGFPNHIAAVRHAVTTFSWHIDHHPNVLGFTRDQILEQLHGKDLACWCPLVTELGEPAPCHADILLAIANPDWVDPRHRPDPGVETSSERYGSSASWTSPQHH